MNRQLHYLLPNIFCELLLRMRIVHNNQLNHPTKIYPTKLEYSCRSFYFSPAERPINTRGLNNNKIENI